MKQESAEQPLKQLEEMLLETAVRRDSEAVSDLLADEFREFGSSGRVFRKRDVMAALQTEERRRFSIEDFRVDQLAAGVALVTYRVTSEPHSQASLRSSLWVKRPGGWRMIFHQGTNVTTANQTSLDADSSESQT